MAEQLFAPISIRYQGLFADQHLVDGQQFGRSIIGMSKIANSICHNLFFESITHDPRSYQIRFCVLPSKENGLLQEIVAVVNSGQLAVFTPVLLKLGNVLIERIFSAVVGNVLGKETDTSKALDTIQQMAKQNAEFQKQVLHGQMQDKRFLQHMVKALARENRAPLRELPEPIGKTVRTMKIGGTPATPTVEIDEPTAEVLRSREPLELADPIEYDVRIEGVFKTNGACRVRLLDDDRIVAGKITDPALEQLHNVYTRALDDAAPLHVVAKPVLKDGKIHRLFISHAEIIRPGGPHKRRTAA